MPATWASPAVILTVQKQPSADTLKLTSEIEAALADLKRVLPKNITTVDVLFRQASFIQVSIDNVLRVLVEALVVVAVVLFLFLMNWRTTAISLTAIPISVLITVIVFQLFGLTINTMTLGGLAIAIGELVDDAVVGRGERVPPPAREQGQSPSRCRSCRSSPPPPRRCGPASSTPPPSSSWCSCRCSRCPASRAGCSRRSGVAYIVSILASLVTSITVTPVLCYYLLPRMRRLEHGDAWLVRVLKAGNRRLLDWAFGQQAFVMVAAIFAVAIAAYSAFFLPRSFLPPFNEGTLTISMLMRPGISLAESNRVGLIAERLILQVPEVKTVGRRTGRAELDEHAEGVHSAEIDVDLKRSSRSREEVVTDIRSRLAMLPAAVNVGQPISHRLDHMLSGVRAQIALKIFGDDLDTLRSLAEQLQSRMAGIKGLVDLQVERQVRIPQVQVAVDYQKAGLYGVTPSHVTEALETLLNGRVVSQIIDGNRRYDVVLRVADADRTTEGLVQADRRDAGGPRAAVVVRAGGRDRRPQPDPARQHAPPHRRASPTPTAPTWRGIIGDIRALLSRSQAAGRLLHHARGHVPGAGGGLAADRPALAGVARRHLHRALQPLSIGGAVADHHGQHSAGADRQRHCAVARRPAALGRHHDRLHHAGRHQRPQRHPQDQPLHQSRAARGRDVRAAA